jgi:hypothetical protein
VVHGVALALADLLVEGAIGVGGRLHLLRRAGQADDPLGEAVRRQIVLQHLRRVALGIDRDEDDLHVLRLVAERLLGRLQHRQRGRAIVGAVGEAEEDQRPFAVQQGLVNRPAVLVDHLERSAHGRLAGRVPGRDHAADPGRAGGHARLGALGHHDGDDGDGGGDGDTGAGEQQDGTARHHGSLEDAPAGRNRSIEER